MIELQWDEVDNTEVLVYRFHNGWTWRDFDEVKQRADSLLMASSVKLPLIFDLTQAPDMPPGMLMHTRTITESRHPNGSPVVIVGASQVIRTTFNIVKRMFGDFSVNLTSDVLFVREWDEIAASLRQHNPS